MASDNKHRTRYAYFGHHKCASTWIDNIIREVVTRHGYSYRGIVDHQTPTGHGVLTDYTTTFSRDELGAHVEQESIDFIGCLTADWSQAAALPSFRGVHVIRDPRDIIVSGYFSHRNSHPVDHIPHMAAHRKRLLKASKDDGLMMEMEYVASEMNDLRSWNYDHPAILELKMENLTDRPYEGFIEIFDFLGVLDEAPPSPSSSILNSSWNLLTTQLRTASWIPGKRRVKVPCSSLLERVYAHRFEKKTGGREKGAADTQSHYRKGQAGDWTNHFTPDHVSAFKERFGDLVVQLGYETSNDWFTSQSEHSLA